MIQLKNDYEREVFNGDLGVVGSIDSTEHEVTIQFEDRAVIYDYADLNELGLAWSIQVGDYEDDDGETCFAIVDTPGYETLTIDGEHPENVDCEVSTLAIKRHIAKLEYPAWYFNAGTIQMKNKQAEEIDLLGTRDRYTYSIDKIGVFDRLVTRFTRLKDPEDIYPFPIEQAWDRSQIDTAMDELRKSIPWDKNYQTLQEKLRAQIAKILESQSEIQLPDLTEIHRIEHGETELNDYIEIAS